MIGFFLSYFILTSTNVLPVNYKQKYEQLYNRKERTQFLEAYIDLANGFMFDYPSNYKVDSLYQSNTGNAVLGDGPLNVGVFEGEKRHDLFRYKLENDQSLLGFAKSFDIVPYQDLREVEYNQITLNGREAVTADFEVTEQQKEITSFVKGVVIKVIDEPIGYKGKLVYIKHNGYVFVWKTGFVDNKSQEAVFNQIVQSFKLIY